MKICATCQKPVADQDEFCSSCSMKAGPYNSPGFFLPSENQQWTMYPPIPRTHWWGTELELGSRGKKAGLSAVVSDREGVFARGPKLNLGVGLYEFHCLLSVNWARPTEIGSIRVLNGETVIDELTLNGADFERENEPRITIIGFRLEAPSENVRCEFSSNDRVKITIKWIRLVPQFAWQWNGDSKGLKHDGETSVTKRGITLQAGSGNNELRLYGPWIPLLPGYYKLLASITVEPSEAPLIATWEVPYDSGEKFLLLPEPMKLDASRHGKPQTISRNFYVDKERENVEFRIWVERGQITVHWLRLILPEGHIWKRYYEIGGKDSPLGLPISMEGEATRSNIGGTKIKGRYRRFEGGTIYFNDSTFEAWEVWGEISALHERLGGTRGFGFPIKEVESLQSFYGKKGEYQLFQGNHVPGRAIFAYPKDRTSVYGIRGSTGGRYWQVGGYNNGPLGFPTSNGEYDWEKESTKFKRSDFEGGYITWRLGEPAVDHYYPVPHIKVDHPDAILVDEELRIKVTGKVDGGPTRGVYCSLAFPNHGIDDGPIEFDEDPNIHIYEPGDSTWGKYGKRSDDVVRYRRVEMSVESWPEYPFDSFEIRVRPAHTGTFRIYAKLVVRDGFDPEVYRSDPDPETPGFFFDKQDEAVYVSVVDVRSKPTEFPSGGSSKLEGTKDFFISYNKADRAWAEWIAWQLEIAGYSAVLQAWDFRAGSNFVVEMDKASSGAERTVVVLSPNYLRSSFAPSEWAAAFRRDPKGEKGLLLPVRVEECEVPGLLGAIVYIDLVGQTEVVARDRLIAGISSERSKPASSPDYPAPTSRAPHFPGA